MAAAFIVQLWLSLAGDATAARVIGEAGLIPARLTGASLDGGGLSPALTLITSIFLHAGWVHFGMNSLFLIVIARDVEPALGALRYLVLFICGGVAGGIAQSVLDTASVVPIIGASGAMSSVFGAYLMHFAARPARANRIFGRRLSPDTAAALRFGGAWLVLQVLTAFAGLGIAVGAHVGGFVVGLLLGGRAQGDRAQ